MCALQPRIISTAPASRVSHEDQTRKYTALGEYPQGKKNPEMTMAKAASLQEDVGPDHCGIVSFYTIML